MHQPVPQQQLPRTVRHPSWPGASEPACATCPDGGTRLSVGTDADGNGTLEATEATSDHCHLQQRAGAGDGLGRRDGYEHPGPGRYRLPSQQLGHSPSRCQQRRSAAMSSRSRAEQLSEGACRTNGKQSILVDQLQSHGQLIESDRRWRSVASSDDGMKLVALEAWFRNENDEQEVGKIYTSTDSGKTWESTVVFRPR